MANDTATIIFADGVKWIVRGELVRKLRAKRDKSQGVDKGRADRFMSQLRQSGGSAGAQRDELEDIFSQVFGRGK